MSEVEHTVRRYIDSFNETDAQKRAAILREIYAEDCGYTDPVIAVRGTAGISDFIGRIQQKYVGVRFALAGNVDAHHEQARFTWHAGPEGAKEPVAIGFDVVVLEKGRIREVYGFLDKAP